MTITDPEPYTRSDRLDGLPRQRTRRPGMFQRQCSGCGVAFRPATDGELYAIRNGFALNDTTGEHGCAR